MAFLGILLLSVVVVSSTCEAISAPKTQELKNSGCVNSCGNVSIQYPFGLKEGCYLDEDFKINCTDSIPYFGDVPVSNISIEVGELRVLMFTAFDCYDNNQSNKHNEPWLKLGKFSISNTKNKFIAIGCDTIARLQFSKGNNLVAMGCTTECASIDDVSPNETCSGIGCCQASFPKGLSDMKIILNSYINHTDMLSFNPCSFAFVVEQGGFNFSTSYLRDFKEETMPMVLDWGIRNETCQKAKLNPMNYACGKYSDCYNTTNSIGYNCKCFEGYHGNPYLADGCQDINECANANDNKCEHKNRCSNMPGSYKCGCPKGYHGDGKTDEKGCIRDQFQVIQVAVGFSIGVIVVLLSSSWLYWIFRKRKLIKLKEKFFRKNGGLMLQQQLSRQLQERSTQEVIKIFTSEELEQATNNYDENRIIGRGGNGIVYKGILTDNRTVAIKKSKMVDENQIDQFINEVIVLSQINHRNVVKLLGCCLETQVPLLVYEFITNGTLFEHIHSAKMESTISWDARLQISAEIAGVLSYLHSATSVPIIHRDVKSTNILLDDNYTAKVSDFGASRLVPLDEMQLSTMVQGTLGYLDPEYLRTSQLTEKSDVYSFGVVLVELLTGKKALSFDRPEEERCLAMYFISSLKNDRLYQIIDKRIGIEEISKQLEEFANLAKRCLKIKGDERPTMKEVAMVLEGLRMKGKHPWISDNFDETESLLGVATNTNEFGGTSKTTTMYDTIRDHIELPVLDGGR